MSGVLFCELSGALVATTADLNKVVSALRLPDLYMLSKETAIAFADDQEEAISLVLKGNSQEHLLRRSSSRLARNLNLLLHRNLPYWRPQSNSVTRRGRPIKISGDTSHRSAI
jgi:hypothetical protein